MQLRTRVSLGSLFAASAVAATALAWHERVVSQQRSGVVERVAAPAVEPQAAMEAQAPGAASTDEAAGDEGTGDTTDEGEAPGPDAPSATIAALDLAWFPGEYLLDVGHERTAELAQLVEAWAANDSQEPRIEYRRGVVFARSTEDRGDDGPYPKSAGPQGRRVCGDASVWLRSALRERLANEELTCDRNVCSYGGAEYAPDGYVVFRPVTIDGEATWALDAWVETYAAALPPKMAHDNEEEVIGALDRLASTRCAGEPVGAY